MGSRKRLVRHEKVLTRVETENEPLELGEEMLAWSAGHLRTRIPKEDRTRYGHPPKLSRDQ